MKKVTIVGAGFSGLSLAHECLKRGLEVKVIDRSNSVGGLISSPVTPNGIYETAANSLMGTAQVVGFLRDNQIEYIHASQGAQRRYIYRERPRQWPLNVPETFGAIIQIIKGLARGYKSLQPLPGETVSQWGFRVVGKSATEMIVAPALQGIYAGNIEEMSASIVLGPAFAVKGREAERVSPMISGPRGMGGIIQDLQSRLQSRGAEFQLGREVNLGELQASHRLVLATGALDAAKILGAFIDSECRHNAKVLSSAQMLSVVTATAFLKRPFKKYPGFGILFPRGQGIRAIGMLMPTTIFSRPQNTATQTWIFGGALDPDAFGLPDQEIEREIRETQFKVFGEASEVLDIRITRWSKVLPHYTKDWEANLAQLRPMSKVWLHGNYLGGIGLSRILERSRVLADEIYQGSLT